MPSSLFTSLLTAGLQTLAILGAILGIMVVCACALSSDTRRPFDDADND